MSTQSLLENKLFDESSNVSPAGEDTHSDNLPSATLESGRFQLHVLGITVANYKNLGHFTGASLSSESTVSVLEDTRHNAGISNFLKAVYLWGRGWNHWIERRADPNKTKVKRTGEAMTLGDPKAAGQVSSHMKELWPDGEISDAQGRPRKMQVQLSGVFSQNSHAGIQWSSSIEFEYASEHICRVRPAGLTEMTVQEVRELPTHVARALAPVYVPPITGLGSDEVKYPIGYASVAASEKGNPGAALRSLLHAVSLRGEQVWGRLVNDIKALSGVTLLPIQYDETKDPYLNVYYQSRKMAGSLELGTVGRSRLQIIMLLAYIYAFTKDTWGLQPFLMFDDPDTYIPAELQPEVFDAISREAENTGTHVLIGTHSPDFALTDLDKLAKVISR